MPSFTSRLGLAALGLALGAAIVGGLQLTGAFGDDHETGAVTDYLGQSALSVCVDSNPPTNPDYEIHPGSGRDDYAQSEAAAETLGTVQPALVSISDDQLQEAVTEAIEFGRANYWAGSYLETRPIEVAIGCPLDPVPADQWYLADQPTSRFSLYVFSIGVEEATALGIPLDGSGLPFVTIESGPIGEDDSDDGFITYATYIIRAEDLADIEEIADVIGTAYGRPSDIHDGVCDDPDHPRCFDLSATPPVLDHNAPSR